MISYAQNREDVLLNRLFPSDHIGFYVDIGACDPVHGSITKHFSDRGWRGMNVEPGVAFETLQAARSRDVNLNVAISSTPGRAWLYAYPESRADATLNSAVAKDNERLAIKCEPKQVDVMTLAQLCKKHVGTRVIDFMSIDVEGHELEVISGGDWRRYRPRVLVVEATFPHSTQPSHDAWEPILLGHDYQFANFDGLNRFYVRSEDASLHPRLATPACIFDDYVPYFVLPDVSAPGLIRDALREQAGIEGDALSLRAGVQLTLFLTAAARRFPSLARWARKLVCKRTTGTAGARRAA